MQSLFELDLDIIDHRSWHSKFEDTCVNEVYARGKSKEGNNMSETLQNVHNKIQSSINQSVRFSHSKCIYYLKN